MCTTAITLQWAQSHTWTTHLKKVSGRALGWSCEMWGLVPRSAAESPWDSILLNKAPLSLHLYSENGVHSLQPQGTTQLCAQPEEQKAPISVILEIGIMANGLRFHYQCFSQPKGSKFNRERERPLFSLFFQFFCPIFSAFVPIFFFFGIAFILIFSLMPKPEFQLLSLRFLPVLQCVAMGTVHIHSDTWSQWFFETNKKTKTTTFFH